MENKRCFSQGHSAASSVREIEQEVSYLSITNPTLYQLSYRGHINFPAISLRNKTIKILAFAIPIIKKICEKSTKIGQLQR